MTRLHAGSNNKPQSRKISLEVPPALYLEFRQLLREQLAKDESFKAKYLAEQFESKLLDTSLSGVTDEQRHGRAIEKWLAREVTNLETNRRIMHADETDFLFLDGGGFPVFADEFIAWCRTAVLDCLGSHHVPWKDLRGSYSGGASTSVRRGCGTIARKYQEGKDATDSVYWHYLKLTRSVQPMPRDFDIVQGNVMFTVPKTSEIDRVACKEPDLNMYCQKAVGDIIRSRLLAKGVDLNDQTINQRLAYEGSVSGELATVDLSSASDSVTVSLVQALLPLEWSMLLMELRSQFTLVPAYVDSRGMRVEAHWHLNEMISSMGNAFTFELESLLFWVIARGCAYFTRTRGRISVYGDDIICPTGLKVSLESALDFFGFTVNRSKSFWDGAFRESCGKHYFSGVEVTPFYVKRLPSKLSDWCLLLNHLRQWSHIYGGICDPTYWPLWTLFAEAIIPRPLWGAKDVARRDALAAPNLRNVARILLKQETNASVENRFQMGALLQWFDTTADRAVQSEVVTNIFPDPERAREMMVRAKIDNWNLGVPVFPEETEHMTGR